jgi:hypothetical protein
MTHPPCITDVFVLSRWMCMEIGKINEGLVRDRKSLAALLLEQAPSAITKKGDSYVFDKPVIALLGQRLPGVCTAISGSQSCSLCPRMCLTAAGAWIQQHLTPLFFWGRSAACACCRMENSGYHGQLCMRSCENTRQLSSW